MLVAVLAMHVAMRDLFGGGRAHVGHFQLELQFLAGQRVVAVQVDFLALDLHDVEDVRLAGVGAAFQLAAIRLIGLMPETLHTEARLVVAVATITQR